MLSAIQVDTTNLGNIVFPEVVKVNEKSGSAQTEIPATLLAERGALGISYTNTKSIVNHVCSIFRGGCYSSQHSFFQLGGFFSKTQP